MAYYNTSGGDRVFCSERCSAKHGQAGKRQFWIAEWRRLLIYERDEYVCTLCNQPVVTEFEGDWHPLMPTLDHIVHQSKGGTDDDDNLRTAHAICNSVRGDGELDEFFDPTNYVEQWQSVVTTKGV